MGKGHGGSPETTNNIMELTAAAEALEWVQKIGAEEAVLVTDSKYVMLGITEWIHGWALRGWRTSAGKPVKNQKEWQRLDTARSPVRVHWKWVRGHATSHGNAEADHLANKGVPV